MHNPPLSSQTTFTHPFIKKNTYNKKQMPINFMEASKRNKAIVEGLYKSLAKGDYEKVSNLLASDLEWWFHGPPNCNHMMRVLTGESEGGRTEFAFKPRTVAALDGGRWVVAEGWKGDRAYWVHVWTVRDDGVITQFREYFNTWVTVRDLRNGSSNNTDENVDSSTSWATIWQSHLPCKNTGGGATSMPGLVLAI